MTTLSQDREFIDSIAPSALENAIHWIASNMSPGDVFGPHTIMDWVASNHTPDEVFEDSVLREWADENR